MYTERRDEQNELIGYAGDGGRTSIPLAQGNRHHQEVMDWVAEGNTPSPDPTLTQRQQALAKVEAFRVKRGEDVAALGDRAALLAEVDAMTSVQDIKEVVRKLAEVAYSAVVGSID